MLKSIDILLGVSVVMLVASMAVTVMTGFITFIGNTRGQHLRQGVADLLLLVNPRFTAQAALQLAEAILLHPLIRDGRTRLGTVVHREELIKLLLELASGTGPKTLEPDLEKQLVATLALQGIVEPGVVLTNIREVSLGLERLAPTLSNTARAHIAILQEAGSDFVAKIDSWFDQTMDRVSQRFTLSTRVVTFFAGLLLAFALQIDVVSLVNRISVDDVFRESLVKQAESVNAAPGSTKSLDVLAAILNQGLITMPDYPAAFARLLDFRHLAGILFTTLLLSLGAPFWYTALNQILQLRSKVALEDDAQRKERQSPKEP